MAQSLPFSPTAASVDPPQSAPDQESQGARRFFDGAGHIFSMYLEMIGEEDKKTAEGWKADADGILIFVGFHLLACASHNLRAIDRFIFRSRGNIDLSIDPGYSTEPTGHLQLLPRKNISDCCQHFESPTCCPINVLSTKICCFGQPTLVHELDHQSYLCSTRDFATAVGAEIHQGHSATFQSTQASAGPCVFCRRSRDASPATGSSSIAYPATPFPVPLPCRRSCVPMPR